MKILIIEDEYFAAQRLKKLLLEINEKFKIIKIIDSIEDAIAFFKKSPEIDLVFQDIQLSDGLSFNIFDSVKIEKPIIFTTAFDEYALKAFKVNSIDYLLKPIKKKDLKKSLDKLNNLQKNENHENINDLMKIMLNKQKTYKERFLVDVGTVMKPISIKNISCFYTRNELVYLLTNKGNDFSINFSLSEIEQKINSNNFFRINRQMIVAYDSIKKIEPYFSNRLILKLNVDLDEDIIVSKRKVADFKNWLK